MDVSASVHANAVRSRAENTPASCQAETRSSLARVPRPGGGIDVVLGAERAAIDL